MTDPSQNALAPALIEGIKLIVAAGANAAVGNSIHTWLQSLLPHQISRLRAFWTSFAPAKEVPAVNKCPPESADLFGVTLSKACNETHIQKVHYWGKAADAVIRDTSMDFDLKQHFVDLLGRISLNTINYLAQLRSHNFLYSEVFNQDGSAPSPESDKGQRFLAQMESAIYGLAELTNDPQSLKLTEFGLKFTDFIGTAHQASTSE